MGKVFSMLRKTSYEEKEAAVINDLKKHLSEMQKRIGDLEKIHSVKRQGHGQTESQKKKSDLPVESSKIMTGANLHTLEKDPNAVDYMTDMINEFKRKCFEIQEDINRFEGFINRRPAGVDNSKKKKGDGKSIAKTSSGYQSEKNKNAVIQIQLYCPHATDHKDYIMQLLLTKLTNLFQDGMKLDIEICKTLSNVQTCTPLIVICQFSSRLSADFKNAVSKVQTGSNTAVLIFHHLKPHALPNVPSSSILTKVEVKSVGIIIDVAFFEKIGLYDCDMNKNAIMTLITFIKDYCKK